MQEANAFAAFNIDAELVVQDRFRFIRLLSQRYGLDINTVWKQFLGNGTTSGVSQACFVLFRRLFDLDLLGL